MQLVKSVAASRLATGAVVVALAGAAVAVGARAFDLTVGGGIALYFVIWWVLLFAVLPFGVQSQVEAGEVVAGSEPGAPAIPALAEKAIWATIVASVVFVATAALLPLSGL